MSKQVDYDFSRIVTPECRWVYPHFFTPHQLVINGKPNGEPRFEVEALFDPDTIGDMVEKAKAVAKQKWPERDGFAGVKFPFKKGDVVKAKKLAKGKKGLDYYDGKIVMNPTSGKDKAPGVVLASDPTAPVLDQSKIYSGCYGYLELNFVAYDGNGDKIPDSVKAYVNFAMKSREGEKIGGRDARQVFAGVIGKTSMEDPTSGLDDGEIPF